MKNKITMARLRQNRKGNWNKFNFKNLSRRNISSIQTDKTYKITESLRIHSGPWLPLCCECCLYVISKKKIFVLIYKALCDFSDKLDTTEFLSKLDGSGSQDVWSSTENTNICNNIEKNLSLRLHFLMTVSTSNVANILLKLRK